ncbi:hypothetical protein GTW43_27205 [Streptomyces sp. SID5785]|uniref:DUF1129 domain-containing protein n=1 Tax=Streptomyces sp. SID5785 TaxID=2690309 RepID=UPI001361182D|nr:DUF1129 domain-containing protein [Streptomyces sp. SID5785]MZD08739.1 hypothetical protein [Streptomyces sp. SID5785]
MGWAVLYIAFGLVALWLLGEVLLQNKARLRWRLLAFVGFLGVVLGVLMPSVVVIGVGAIAFAIGQTYVTLSFRRGFDAGWSLKSGGADDEDAPAPKRRRKKEPVHQDPTLEVSGLEAADDTAAAYDQPQPHEAWGPAPESPAESTAVYAPEPMPDDTGQYGVYSDAAYAQAGAGAPGGQDPQGYGYDTGSYGYDQQNYGYDTGQQQQYAAPYSDPYIGGQAYPEQAPYGDPYATGGQQQYSDPYATAAGYGTDTPPGGVWVPQQRNGEEYQQDYGGELPPEQPYPAYPQHDPNTGYDTGYNEQQYRY